MLYWGGCCVLHARRSPAPDYRPTSAETYSNDINGVRLSGRIADDDNPDGSVSEPVAWTRHLTLKSNVLGLGLLIANTAVEIDLGQRLSFHIPVYYSALDYFSETVKFRTFALQPELRYRPVAVKGLFAGVHFGMAYFNLATGGDYRIQDRDGNSPMLGGGISLGYRLHFSKDSRWGIEFAVGGGAYSCDRDRFINEKNGPYVDTISKAYIGLDNLSVSLTYDFSLGRKCAGDKGGRK